MFIFVFLAGCWDRTELNDLALISGIAFDKTEDNRIETTVQIIIPQNQGEGGKTGGALQKTIVRSEAGINISDALSKLQRKIPRKIFWGQCKTFIFSKDVAESGIKEEFDFLVRHPQPRERAYMFVSAEKAAEALEVFPSIESSSSQVLEQLANLQVGITVTLEQLSMMLKGEARTAVLPLVRILPKNKSAKPFQTIPYIDGTVLIKKDKMIGKITEKTTHGLMWILNEVDEFTLSFAMDKDEEVVSLKPVKARVKLIPAISNDKWMMTIKIKAEGDIIQNETDLNPMNPKVLNMMNEAFKEDIEGRIKKALQVIQQENKTDVLGFATAFHRKYPHQWEKNKDRWDEMFPRVEVTLDIKTSIQRPGLINSPGGIPEEEVQKQ
ncbi:Ger(x)C family spore germination protein [Paenibacillus typhae]|nr:Ger(x)C family spore germination protein [Paenibacillus typhae]